MKTKLLIMTSLLSLAFIASADDTKSNAQADKFEVIVNTDGAEVTKKIIVNGKQLSDEEIAEFEASGKMKVLHMDSSHMSKNGNNVIVIKGDGSEHGDMEKHIKIITKHMDDGDGEDIQVFIEKDGDKTTEKIIVNGKELSEQEIEEFNASGKMKVIHLDSDMSDMSDMQGHKMMIINSDSEHGKDIDIEVIMDKLGGLQDLHMDESTVKEWISEDGQNITVIKKSFVITDDDSASLGFVAKVAKDGWHLTKIMDKSGAKDAGILEGDIVTSIGGVNLTSKSGSEKFDAHSLPKFEKGEMIKVKLERDGQPITFDVQARMLDKSALTVDLRSKGGEHFEWIEKLHKEGDVSKNIKVIVLDGKDADIELNKD